ncbi:MAG TPA: thioesterase domain-containing protein [Rhizomicrobium sp.]|nr:thioesterase domain-containing protein [Rhizomicrobium sp.]
MLPWESSRDSQRFRKIFRASNHSGKVTQLDTQQRPSIWNLVAKTSKPIVRLAGRSGGAPLYLVHAVGGDVGVFQPFAEMIADSRTIYGIQVPSHKFDAESSIYELAEYYVDALMHFQPEGPVMLGGWSVGSTIALEMAQILKRRGRDVPLLISFDGNLYHTGARISAWSPRYLRELLGNVRHWANDARSHRLGVVCTIERLYRDWRMARDCWAIERNLRGKVSVAFLKESAWPPNRLPLIRSLYRAGEVYYPKPYDGRVLVYLATIQSLFHLWQVEACWARIAPKIDFHSIYCMHEHMFEKDLPKQMGLHLREYLLKLMEPSQPAPVQVTAEAREYNRSTERSPQH